MKQNIKEEVKKIISQYLRTSDKNINFKILTEIAQLRKGKIKEGEVYVNATTKMTFIDKLGNEFKMTPNAIKSNKWSPYESCRVLDPEFHMKEIEKIVLSKKGKIKDGEKYINNSTKMIFIDQWGNEFGMTPGNLKTGRWSPYESGNVYDNPDYHMQELQKIALSKKGKIKKGERYINANTKMTFIDKLGNEFSLSPTSVKSGRWSPYESGRVHDSSHHIEELQKIALLKGGKIKDGEKYIHSKTKMTFIDQLGNEFSMIPSSIKAGYWSPYEKNYSENICRQIIEQLYNKTFPSSWDIIKRKGKRSLQLDGYNDDLKIAFEYQGIQHTIGWFNKDKNKQKNHLIEIQKRDKEKKQICIDKNILLLEINYYNNIDNIQNIINQTINDIKKSYEKFNLSIPDYILNMNPKNIKIDFAKISHLVLMQKKIEKIVLSKGGKIKDGERYIHSNTKMTFIDKLGNEFRMTPGNLKTGYWSPYESGRVRSPEYHMQELQKIALSKGGKIKDGESYINGKTKITFIDQLGNEFKMTPSSIKKGSWSPYESGTVRNSEYHMQELQKIALSKGGKIKNGESYINGKTKIIFIDKLGNEFKVTPNAVKSGNWSPYESGNIYDPNYHMQELQKIALLEGYKIKEGEIYVNAKTKITFIDKLGNEFRMNPNNFKSGRRPRIN